MSAIDILFEDGEALVIDKPAGLPLDPPRKGGPSLQDECVLRLGFAREPHRSHPRPRTSGACCPHPKALQRFSLSFENAAWQAVSARGGPVDGGRGHRTAFQRHTQKDGWLMIPSRAVKSSITHGASWRTRWLNLVEFRRNRARAI